MSAFMVSNKHLDYMLHAGLRYGRTFELSWHTPMDEDRRNVLTRETVNDVGIMLAAENRRSVNHRYGESNMEDFFEFSECRGGMIDLVQVLKLIDCYEYQSCEHPEWKHSEARIFCDALRRLMIGNLPGYEEAAWSMD